VKKLLSFVIILFLQAQNHVSAQDSLKKDHRIYFMLNIGASLNNVAGSKIDHTQYWNDQSGIGKVTWSQATGIAASIQIEKLVSTRFFLKSGLGFVQKQAVIDNTVWIQKDHLKTGYLYIPVLIGFNIYPRAKAFNVWFELGPSFNFAIIKKSYNTDAEIKTTPVTTSVAIATGLKYTIAPNVRLTFSYMYVHDLNAANTQQLSLSTYDPTREYDFKFRSHLVMVGVAFQKH
jgi:opacity protein-like surface antigen